MKAAGIQGLDTEGEQILEKAGGYACQGNRRAVPAVPDPGMAGQKRNISPAGTDLTSKTAAELPGGAIDPAVHPGLSGAELD